MGILELFKDLLNVCGTLVILVLFNVSKLGLKCGRVNSSSTAGNSMLKTPDTNTENALQHKTRHRQDQFEPVTNIKSGVWH